MRRINKLINRGILPWSDPIIRYFFILTFSHNQNLRKECVSVNKENWHFKQLSDKLVHSVPSISVGLWGLKIYSVTNLTWLLKSFNSLSCVDPGFWNGGWIWQCVCGLKMNKLIGRTSHRLCTFSTSIRENQNYFDIWGIREKKERRELRKKGGGVEIHPFHFPWIRAWMHNLSKLTITKIGSTSAKGLTRYRLIQTV